jgi:hypothetical protein
MQLQLQDKLPAYSKLQLQFSYNCRRCCSSVPVAVCLAAQLLPRHRTDQKSTLVVTNIQHTPTTVRRHKRSVTTSSTASHYCQRISYSSRSKNTVIPSASPSAAPQIIVCQFTRWNVDCHGLVWVAAYRSHLSLYFPTTVIFSALTVLDLSPGGTKALESTL